MKPSNRYLKIVEWLNEDGAPLPPATAGRDCSGKFVVRGGKELHRANQRAWAAGDVIDVLHDTDLGRFSTWQRYCGAAACP